MSRYELLKDLKKRSGLVRQYWQEQSIAYQKAKFATSLQALDFMYRH